jgi:hypothetical protein
MSLGLTQLFWLHLCVPKTKHLGCFRRDGNNGREPTFKKLELKAANPATAGAAVDERAIFGHMVEMADPTPAPLIDR